MEISKRGGQIAPSATLEISAKVKALKAEGKQIVAFTAGEPDFNTPEYIIDAAKRALDEGKTKYTASSGIPELKRAIVKKFKNDNGLDYTESQIVVSDGAKSSLFHALSAIINEGDEVIVAAPYWVTYVEQIKLCQGVSVVINTDKKSGYKLIKPDLEKAITPKTKCIIINSPTNPTGVVYNEKELKDIAEVAEEHGLYVISDEVYEKLVFGDQKHISIAGLSDYMKEHTITVNGVSKTYSMTGWRIGYLAAPENVAKAIGNIQSHTTSNPCSFAQYASLEALSGEQGEEFIAKMKNEFSLRRELICDLLNEGGLDYIYPNGAFYVFLNIEKYIGKEYNGKKIDGSVGFADCLLEAGVAVVPGIAFGADGFVRLSYTVSRDDIKVGIGRICEFIKALK